MIPLVVSIIAKTETLQRDFARARGSMRTFEQATTKTSQVVYGLSRQLLTMVGVGGGLYALQRGLRRSVTEYASFEHGMAKVSTMLDDQTRRLLPDMKNEIRGMSIAYGEAKESMVEGLYDILSGQVKAEESTKLLEVAVRSAKGGFTESATTTKALIQVLKAYNWEVGKAERVSDIMHATVRQGRFTFEEYASEIGDIIGLAAFLDIRLEAVGASIATMTKAGLSADKAITALKNIMNQFLYPTEQARKAAAELGFTLDENSIKGDGLIKIMQGLSKAEARHIDILMPSIRGLVGFASQLKNVEELAKDYESIINSAGLTQKNLGIAMDTTTVSIDQMKMSFDKLYETVGEKLAPALNNLFINLRDIISVGPIDFFKDTAEVNQRAIEQYRQITKDTRAFTYPQGMLGPPVQPRESQMWDIILKKQWEAYDRNREEYMRRNFAGGGGGRFGGYGATGGWKELPPGNLEITPWAEQRMIDMQLKAEKLRQEEAFVGPTISPEMLKKKQELLRQQQEMADFISKKWAEVGRNIEMSMSDAFHSMIMDGASFKDAMERFALSIADTFARMASDMAARAIMGSLGFGAPFSQIGAIRGGGGILSIFGHKGGTVGNTGFQLRAVPASVFANAPRLHSGLMSDEFPAILQRGEEVIPKGGGNLGGKLDTLISILSQRQTINANIIDRRDVITRERIEGREGEGWTMNHIKRSG